MLGTTNNPSIMAGTLGYKSTFPGCSLQHEVEMISDSKGSYLTSAN